MTAKVVAIASGGLDSTTMLYRAVRGDTGVEVVQVLSFNYGQRHQKELDFALQTCESLHLPFSVIDLWRSGVTDLLSQSGSSLVSDTEVPEGHYSEESMKATVVPNRNMMMLSIAGAVAVAQGAEGVLIGVHSGDHAIYPDCRQKFIILAGLTLSAGNEGFGKLAGQAVFAPFLFDTKADIAFEAFKYEVPLNETWSCYIGGEYHCGRCGTCVERLEAIDEAQQRWRTELDKEPPMDLTVYEDADFWRKAVNV
jgi:7-cyano-7-deazaguanine synthase